jgi:hypothetical protein
MVYNTQDYWFFWTLPSSGILETRKTISIILFIPNTVISLVMIWRNLKYGFIKADTLFPQDLNVICNVHIYALNIRDIQLFHRRVTSDFIKVYGND